MQDNLSITSNNIIHVFELKDEIEAKQEELDVLKFNLPNFSFD